MLSPSRFADPGATPPPLAATDETIRAVLTGFTRIALVGASPRPERPSYGVMGFLLRHGFDVTPINPQIAGQEIHGRTARATLEEAGPLEIVDIFRASDKVGPVVDEAIRLGAKVIWMQLGVVNRAAAEAAQAAGLTVIMDRCPAIEWPRLGLGLGLGPGVGPGPGLGQV